MKINQFGSLPLGALLLVVRCAGGRPCIACDLARYPSETRGHTGGAGNHRGCNSSTGYSLPNRERGWDDWPRLPAAGTDRNGPELLLESQAAMVPLSGTRGDGNGIVSGAQEPRSMMLVLLPPHARKLLKVFLTKQSDGKSPAGPVRPTKSVNAQRRTREVQDVYVGQSRKKKRNGRGKRRNNRKFV